MLEGKVGGIAGVVETLTGPLHVAAFQRRFRIPLPAPLIAAANLATEAYLTVLPCRRFTRHARIAGRPGDCPHRGLSPFRRTVLLTLTLLTLTLLSLAIAAFALTLLTLALLTLTLLTLTLLTLTLLTLTLLTLTLLTLTLLTLTLLSLAIAAFALTLLTLTLLALTLTTAAGGATGLTTGFPLRIAACRLLGWLIIFWLVTTGPLLLGSVFGLVPIVLATRWFTSPLVFKQAFHGLAIVGSIGGHRLLRP